MGGIERKNMSVQKKTRDAAMRIILDFYQAENQRRSIGLEYIEHIGLPGNADARTVIEVLSSMGLITYEKWKDGTIHSIAPSESGKSYFEREEDEKAKRKELFHHDWKIALFSTLAGALASEPLWKGIKYLASIIQSLLQSPGSTP